MSQFPTFTILPVTMPASEIVRMARESGRMAITNGRSIMLAPRLLKGYRQVRLFTLTKP